MPAAAIGIVRTLDIETPQFVAVGIALNNETIIVRRIGESTLVEEYRLRIDVAKAAKIDVPALIKIIDIEVIARPGNAVELAPFFVECECARAFELRADSEIGDLIRFWIK